MRDTAIVDIEVTLDKEALKLHRQLEVGRCEELFDSLTEFYSFLDIIKVLVPIFCRIREKVMIFDFVFGGRDPNSRLFCQKLRISVLR